MQILGIDTATKTLNLAIVRNSEIIIDYKIDSDGKTHSTKIIPLLNNMLILNELKISDIEGIAVSIGPGSFTGLRIGLSTAKGLAFALSIPIAGINTLESYAFSCLKLPGLLCPIIEARKGEYYYAIYSNQNNNLVSIKKCQCEKWSNIKKELLKREETVYVYGYRISEILKEERMEKIHRLHNIIFVNDHNNVANAANIALIGEKRILSKLDDDIFQLIPFYINKSSAEIRKDQERKT